MFSGVLFFSSRRRHTRFDCDWSSDVCSSDLLVRAQLRREQRALDLFARTGVDPLELDPMRAAEGRLDAEGAWPRVADGLRSEERRVGKECRSRWSPYH